MIDSYTRRYVGDIIWQVVTKTQTDYYNWANSADGDNYILGGGDYQYGAEIKQEAYNAMQQTIQYWKNFYYKKLNSDVLKRGIQEYIRENVSYFQKDDGTWYASGFRNGMQAVDYLTGFKVAPGTMEDPEGTMGYTGDWATPAAYNNAISTQMRALIALDSDYEDVIDFDDIGEDHQDMVDKLNRAKGTVVSTTSGRSGRSGGSGGGSGSSSIYSRPSNVNIPTGKTVSTNRPNNSKFDYLRPNFETKGSREAYKRSDF